MAFCNSCGATLTEGTKFCSKCGAAVAGASAGAAPPSAAPVAPPPTGSSSALKIILMVVGGIVLIGVLGMVTCGIVLHRAFKSAKVSQKGESVKVETPFGSFSANNPEETVKELNVDIYPGAQVQKDGTATASVAGIHTVTANFQSDDPVDKVCEFYKSKFTNATVSSSDPSHCSIVSRDRDNSTNIAVETSGSGSRFQIVQVSKKSASDQ
jgi:hypothetical protein